MRLGAHKRRTLTVLDYLNNEISSHKLSASQFFRYSYCHNHLLFHHYPALEKTKLHEVMHCDIHLLCPMCAIRRAARSVMKYEEKYRELLSRNPVLKLYYVVLTVKNMENLEEGFEHLEKSMRLLVKRRREAISYVNGKSKASAYAAGSVFAGVAAGAYSFEVKRGANSGLWHPHVNLLLLSDKQIRTPQLMNEWYSITEDSYIVDCQRVRDSKQSFVEIFKYALKFSDMTPADTYHTWETLRTRRLCGSFGDFRGLEITKADEHVEPSEEFIELFYRFEAKRYAPSDKNRL